MKSGDAVKIHYAAKNQMPDPKWREREGTVLVVTSGGKGPRNVAVRTDIGDVVVPRWNCREVAS